MYYKGYTGHIYYKNEDKYIYGYVLGLRKTYLGFCGKTKKSLVKDFQSVIDRYLELCFEKSEEHEIPDLEIAKREMIEECEEMFAEVDNG